MFLWTNHFTSQSLVSSPIQRESPKCPFRKKSLQLLNVHAKTKTQIFPLVCDSSFAYLYFHLRNWGFSLNQYSKVFRTNIYLSILLFLEDNFKLFNVQTSSSKLYNFISYLKGNVRFWSRDYTSTFKVIAALSCFLKLRFGIRFHSAR